MTGLWEEGQGILTWGRQAKAVVGSGEDPRHWCTGKDAWLEGLGGDTLSWDERQGPWLGGWHRGAW